jgi:hypothetical protein
MFDHVVSSALDVLRICVGVLCDVTMLRPALLPAPPRQRICSPQNGVSSGGDRPTHPSRARSAAHLRVIGAARRRGSAPLAEDDGHASITVTAHIYADLCDDELDDIASALDALDDACGDLP